MRIQKVKPSSATDVILDIFPPVGNDSLEWLSAVHIFCTGFCSARAPREEFACSRSCVDDGNVTAKYLCTR